MATSNEDILKILQLIEQSGYDEVKVECGDLKVHVRKSASTEAAPLPAAPPPAAAAPSPPVRPSTAQAASEAIPAGFVAVRAPMVGTFYRAPGPGERPFVEVGDTVGPDDTVCLVEVMKLFSSVKADTAGKVAEILAENGAMVEYGQVLMLIEAA